MEGGTSDMNENVTGGGAAMAYVPLAENNYVNELFGILKENGKDATGLTALLDHVKGMESFCMQAESKITDMKCQLDDMKEIQDHPIKYAIQNTVKALETKVAEIKTHLAELKANIIDGCKNAVAAIKDKGIVVLDKLASFFRIKTCLEKVNSCTVSAVKDCDKTIAMVESFSKEYHKAGRGLKNMARILVGKEPIDAVKESGKLAKAMSAPARAEKSCMLGIQRAANSMISKLEQLNQRAETIRDDKAAAKKPTLMERLQDKKELVRQKDLERPALVHAPKAKGMEV